MWTLVVKSLIVHEKFLVRSPGVFTPLLFFCKPEFLINSSECLGSASISIRSGAFPNGGTTQRITRFRIRTSHTSRSCGRGPNVAMCLTIRLSAQFFLEFRDLSSCRKCREIIIVSEYTDVFDKMFEQTRIEHTNVVVQLLHRPITVRIKALCLRPSFHTLHD